MENDRLFFPYEDGDDLVERYEDLLFEDKQFFTTKAIVPKVFKARLEKMKKREEAFRRISGRISEENIPNLNFQSKASRNLKDIYLMFQKEKAIIFQQMYGAHEINSVVILIETLLDRFLQYSENWRLNEGQNTHEILLSKEPDPSELYAALNAFALAGGETVNEIETLFFKGKNELLAEAKRLSLLLQNDSWK